MELWSVAEAAEYLGLSMQRVRQFCKQKRIGQKVGKQWVFTRQEIEQFAAIPRPTGRPKEGEDD